MPVRYLKRFNKGYKKILDRPKNIYDGQKAKCAVKSLIITSNGEKSWLTRKARPPTGTTRNSTLKVSWFPS